MNEIYGRINEITENKYAMLRFPYVTFGDGFARVAVVCRKQDRKFVDGNIGELTMLVKEICDFHAGIALDICDNPATPTAIRSVILTFTEKYEYATAATRNLVVENTESGFVVKIKMHKMMYELSKATYIPALAEMLENTFVENIVLDVRQVEFFGGGNAMTLRVSDRTEYALGNVKPIFGNLVPEMARSLSSLTSSGYGIVACGVFVMPTAYTSKGGRAYEKFLLYDGDVTVQCWFGSGGISLVRSELINKTVCVLGNVEYDGSRHEASISVGEISLCDIDGLSALPHRPQPDKYSVITPQNYEVFVQSSMFDNAVAFPPALAGDFVVFDFETTGLSVLYDKPTELGAIKISNGRLKESFSTLIDPRREIPETVSEKTGITNEMVKGQPLFEDILPDFYRFTYGCSVVCHNIAFDFPFLIRSGNRCGWAFGDRKTFDTMGLAPLVLHGLPDIRLETVIERLGLTNDSAHRALSDAVATARAFIELQKSIAQK